jgi:hypothetical protein
VSGRCWSSPATATVPHSGRSTSSFTGSTDSPKP